MPDNTASDNTASDDTASDNTASHHAASSQSPARRTIRLFAATDDGAGPAADRGPLMDAALGAALLQQVGAGAPETLRVYRPEPTLAFSGRDCASPHISAAAEAARAAGFVPVRRGPGGRAAAYHRGSLCLDHVGPVTSTGAGTGPDVQQIRPRFAAFAELITGALRAAGVDAGIGAVPGEYCPGEFSIHDGAGHKLVGTAQRLVRGAWLFGTVIVVRDPEPLRSVLDAVYATLGLEWDPASVGAVSGAVSGVGVDDVLAAVLDAYRQLADLVPERVPDDAIKLARTRLDLHRVPERAG